MFDLKMLMEINRQNCEALQDPLSIGPAVSCTRTFTVLPLRYAAVGGNPHQRQQLPTLPEHLRHPHCIAALHHADYAIRPLREGFLYVMEKRRLSGQYSLHPPYRITANGALSLYDPEQPEPKPPGISTFQDVVRAMTWAFTVHDLDDLLELRLFYSPDPLTIAAQRQLLRRRDLLPAVDIAPFAGPGCPKPRPYTLRHDQLNLVADFAAESNDGLRTLLDAQVFSTPSISSLAAARQALGPLGSKPEARGVAVVVEDAIGITQELNAWRNAGMEHLKHWLEASTKKGGPSNERKVLVAQTFTELHHQFTERKIAVLVDRRIEASRAHFSPNEQVPHSDMTEWWIQNKEGLYGVSAQFERQTLGNRAKSGEFAKQFEDRYLPLVNLQGMHQHLETFEAQSAEARRLAESRAADHLTWLKSSALVDALAHYDENDLANGLCFAHQTGLCVAGLEGVPAGAALLAQWWRADAVTPDNLALRSFVHNQREIAEVLAQTRTALDALAPGSDPFLQLEAALKQAKELAAHFSRLDSHLDQLTQHSPTNTAGALAWLGQLGRQSLSVGAPGSTDRMLYRRLSTYLIASLGKQAVELRLSEQALDGKTPAPGRVAAPIVRRLDRAYTETLHGVHGNQFYRLRVASGLLLLEAGLLLLQGRRDDKDRRFWSEVTAAAFTSAAAGMELLAVGTELTLRGVGGNSVTARGALVSLGRYRLWGAGLAAMGGIVSIKWDFSDATDADNRSKTLLALAYRMRAVSTIALLIGQGGIAFSQASALLSWLSARATTTYTINLSTTLSGLSARLAANNVAMLWLSRLSWFGGTIVLVSSTVLLIIDEDALEKWCNKCCFRIQLSDKGYTEDSEELKELFSAIRETI
ncbi:T6SS effector BTH_I2691 family protein [Pseudomonas sp. URMO17WK12:I11]|uniref:T6SS effector BTH_I2691 family protein n=1 Tax=Pseudomonas sp. URMO17WK12:I11 TaxID=1283291 RepID=UPI0011A174AF|nr:T6SS effector BTH_I2691 family protein [Pseudomonas sp. URMO17WK12:I11]